MVGDCFDAMFLVLLAAPRRQGRGGEIQAGEIGNREVHDRERNVCRVFLQNNDTTCQL
jgi:hypothetical protein